MEEQQDMATFLKAHGVTHETSAAEVEELKAEYMRQYHQHYYQKRKQSEHRFTVRLTPQEYTHLRSYADAHNEKSLNKFVKQAALAYLNQQYISRQPELIAGLIKEIRSCGRLINQVVQKIHWQLKRDRLTGAAKDTRTYMERLENRYQAIHEQVNQMEYRIAEYEQSPPPKLGKVVWVYLKAHPETVEPLHQLLEDFKRQHHADHQE